MHCDDCGTKLDNGLCPNCHEEAHIWEHQQDDFDPLPSREFMDKVWEQEKHRKPPPGRTERWERG